ncbi:MAG TPA: 7-carboxy-7-deazaguanine synthase QueE [Puia sp.]|nr:7-carboxy-7-deazaguanine synthase QueE [Puia sp.]
MEETIIDVLGLPVMESFYTIQGEGFHQGKAAFFIRLGGCDIGCVWCDVKESWNADAHPKQSVEAIVNNAVNIVAGYQSRGPGISSPYIGLQSSDNEQRRTNIVIITGGEPLMHNCTELTKQLHQAGFQTHIETSGAYPLSGEWDWICFSPKKFKEPLISIAQRANELKVIIFNKSDFEWAERYAALVSSSCKLYLQPEWDKSSIVTLSIIEYIKKNPHWEFSLQLHKYINVP